MALASLTRLRAASSRFRTQITGLKLAWHAAAGVIRQQAMAP